MKLHINSIKKITLSAIFLAIGMVLPFLTGQIKEFGDTLLPMHIPIMLCGLVCGYKYGFVIGFLYFAFHKKQIWWLYCCLIVSMISGRIVWGIAKTILLGVAGKAFTIQAFIAGGFIDSLPGIILQLVLIPVIIKFKDMFLERSDK